MMNISPEKRAAAVLKGIETRRRNKARRELEEKEKADECDYYAQKLKALKAEIAHLQEFKEFSKISQSLGCKAFYSEEQIVQNSLAWERHVGVYFLISEKKVVYVGQSVQVPSRVQAHNDKKFDSVAVIRCNEDQLDRLESLYIHFLKPALNGSYNGAMAAPIPLDRLLAL